jgi:ribonuclease HI
MKFIVHTDGGARGNPGPAAVGVVIEEVESDNGNVIRKKLLAEFGKRIGETTNNVAEYTAVIEALHFMKNYPIIKLSNFPIIQFFLDSKLVVEQLSGNYKVKDPKLRELTMQVKRLERECAGVVAYAHIPREENSLADLLVNRALDARGQ